MLKKIALFLASLSVLAVIGLAGFLFLGRPLSRPPLEVSAGTNPDRLARGQYLAFTAGCIKCHSKRDFTRYSGPPVAPFGAHGTCFRNGDGVPGQVCAANLTSDTETGIGNWTDGEVVRAMREGVSREGHPLFPAMPYSEYRNFSDEDALSIVAYLRTLPATSYKRPETKIDFPLNVIMRLIPKPLDGPVATPARADRTAYGEYLTKTHGCAFCHTTMDEKMNPVPGREFAGDNEFKGPWGITRSANLTPHATGLGDKTKENFIGLFRAFGNVEGALAPGAPNTLMPWATYNHLTDDDLGIIYDYRKAQKPVDLAVEKFPKAAGVIAAK